MFERFLERLSKSKYKDNFILKGGFLLSSIMGINIRATMDIDANITGMDFNEKDIKDMIKEIASIKLDDHVTQTIHFLLMHIIYYQKFLLLHILFLFHNKWCYYFYQLFYMIYYDIVLNDQNLLFYCLVQIILN